MYLGVTPSTAKLSWHTTGNKEDRCEGVLQCARGGVQGKTPTYSDHSIIGWYPQYDTLGDSTCIFNIQAKLFYTWDNVRCMGLRFSHPRIETPALDEVMGGGLSTYNMLIIQYVVVGSIPTAVRGSY